MADLHIPVFDLVSAQRVGGGGRLGMQPAFLFGEVEQRHDEAPVVVLRHGAAGLCVEVRAQILSGNSADIALKMSSEAVGEYHPDVFEVELAQILGFLGGCKLLDRAGHRHIRAAAFRVRLEILGRLQNRVSPKYLVRGGELPRHHVEGESCMCDGFVCGDVELPLSPGELERLQIAACQVEGDRASLTLGSSRSAKLRFLRPVGVTYVTA